MPEDRKREVAVVVPAKDEETRIGAVLQAVREAKLPTEVIVVSDGSTDQTAEVARGFAGVRVVELFPNEGKAAALLAGVKSTAASIIVFVDADLEGLRGSHVDQLILPVLSGECEMSVGIFRGGQRWSDAAHKVSPGLSGQRAIKRELFLAVPNLRELGMAIEVELNKTAKRRNARVLRVVLRGVSNSHKEQKLGWVKGIAARTKMFKEITEAMVKPPRNYRPRRRRNRRPPKWW